jgi:hypothetical protein
MLNGAGFADIYPDMLILFLMSVVFIAIVVLLFRWDRDCKLSSVPAHSAAACPELVEPVSGLR